MLQFLDQICSHYSPKFVQKPHADAHCFRSQTRSREASSPSPSQPLGRVQKPRPSQQLGCSWVEFRRPWFGDRPNVIVADLGMCRMCCVVEAGSMAVARADDPFQTCCIFLPEAEAQGVGRNGGLIRCCQAVGFQWTACSGYTCGHILWQWRHDVLNVHS